MSMNDEDSKKLEAGMIDWLSHIDGDISKTEDLVGLLVNTYRAGTKAGFDMAKSVAVRVVREDLDRLKAKAEQ